MVHRRAHRNCENASRVIKTGMRKNILVTGKPRSGKSTLLNKLIENVVQKAGFVTKEIRENGERIAFEIETHSGERKIFCDTRVETPYKVSRYFVSLPALEEMLSKVSSWQEGDLLYLDEIGQMQLLSEKFKEFVVTYLDAANTCIATISYIYEDEFTKRIKERDDVILVEISEEDREEKEAFLCQLLKKIEKARRYVAEPERFTQNGDTVELRSEHGTRALVHNGNKWKCSCDFFDEHQICSHVIATEEVTG